MFLQFWGAAGEVTGSCHLVEAGGRRVLIDCGLIQGPPEREARNREAFPFDPRTVDAVILTHAHLDHSGRLPLLVKNGFSGPIYTHRATRDLCRIMLKDAAYLNEKEAQWTNRKRQRKRLPPVEPLYVTADATNAMRRFHGLPHGEVRNIVPGIKVRLRDAGHILGSSIVELWVREGGVQRKLVFSGDLGHCSAPILRDPEPVDDADLVVLESTYGDRRHRSWDATWAELGGVLRDASEAKGNILIPAFAVGRTQELLYAFGRNFEPWDLARWAIFLDSPMAIQATEIYARHSELYDAETAAAGHASDSPFHLPNLHLSRTANQSMAINRLRSGAIIIAGSGMCTGGRIKHHLKHNAWRRSTHIVFVGFQAQGTLGRALVDGAEEIQLWGETVRVAAGVHTIGGFSAHADQDGLARWYGGFADRPPVALIHGEPRGLEGLRQRLGEDYRARVSIPKEGTRIDLARSLHKEPP
ncbi:MAG: MBL fold metallo-hydrolase [Gammaproteobacteria bacterium]|nr:MBL fold metallo-hydrolase [Gammaproteobacteria bacterium]NIR97322.1 MBL fold metallo-hydrolase [Gammaproteobacteria bacterium]NIT63365.1 MBL fold metallo-hydrolase [Gammaproteobacteria bacterium]NIV20292.1 MBL fold metallo-hydrolase [Gammaproteobacteria bacterium]NIX10709.1 MBL fold metallo-hydrolase [Gammaproteobacteria bacterium]